ncbi:Ankyrin Repeat [Orbilia oligospora]|uniref:Ankyrin Repeat n=1 Tax=Orbilia oligospora TaxID=2813651 RepID=A0A7C8PKC2_ORBOL|nr:Ankyrin Repeat [Orbilia oligospora]TGJ63775.1 Ankyrin Repeat [Orbilia oligospora]
MATANYKKKLTHNDYTVGLIYVKPLEMDAILTMLDEEHESLRLNEDDDNEYTLGRIGPHNVLVVGPPRGEEGKVAVSTVVNQVRLSFKNIKMGLLVGIGDGVPRNGHDVRLGDVVVSAPEYGPAVVQYDLGRLNTDGVIEVIGTLGKPPRQLLNVANIVRSQYLRLMEGEESFFHQHLKRFEHFPRLKCTYSHPEIPDILFPPSYFHEDSTDCESHHGHLQVSREERSQDIEIHYSTILSGDSTMSCGMRRDKLSAQHHNALCFETAAAGLMDNFPCLVIRGISSYADSHKNEAWEGYAAATAAAYAREILCTMAERVAVELKPSTAEMTIGQNSVEERLKEAEERIEFLRMLSLPGGNNQRISIESAYANTYEWIEDWKSSDGRKLLIVGKAGSESQH